MSEKVKVLDINIDIVSMHQALQIVEAFIAEGTPRMVATANAEMIMMANQDKELATILNNADLVVADGAGVVWAAKYQGHPVPERVAGFDLVQNLLKEAAQKKYKIYFFGGAPGIAEKAKAVAERNYPGVNIVGTRNGFFEISDTKSIIDDIISVSPDVLLVALGVPKQEKWITQNLNNINVPLVIGVGGTFDVMAGVMKRAPLWMQKANMEWLFRLLMQPKRFIRMLALPRFVIQVMRSKKD